MPTPTTLEPSTPSPPSSGTPPIASFRRVLKNRNFGLLWLAQLISLTVLNAANFGVIVLVNEVTNSVIMVGIAIITFTLPAIPFSAIAGVMVDRLDKRAVLWISNVLRAITMFLIFLVLLSNQTNLWPVYVLTFTTALIGQFFTPAEAVAIPLLVGDRELMPAIALFNITMTLSQAIGFLLLGRIVATIFPPFTLHLFALTLNILSIDMLFVLVALCYLICAGLIFAIPAQAFHEKYSDKQGQVPGVNPPRTISTQKLQTQTGTGKALKAVWREIVQGWRFVRSDRLLYFAVVQLSVVGVILQLISELAGPFVVQLLHRPAADMSIILAPAAFGLVGAAIFMPRITERVGKIRLTVVGFISLALGLVLVPISQFIAVRLDPQHGAESPLLLWITILLVFVMGAAMSCVNIPTQTMMQERTPERARGRVFSLQLMLYNTGTIPVLLFAGVIAQYVGLSQFIFIASASMLLFCWWGVRYISRRGQKEEPNEQDGKQTSTQDILIVDENQGTDKIPTRTTATTNENSNNL